MRVGAMVPAKRFPGIPGRVHGNDLMVAWGDREKASHYASSGRAALDVIMRGVATAGISPAEATWLDFGCGHGRVVRFLTQEVSPERVWVTDISPEAVAFCAKEFAVHPIYPSDGISALKIAGFDVIYAISVLTHLPEDDSNELLSFLGRALNPGGVAIVTTHGPATLSTLGRYGQWCEDRAEEVGSQVRQRGVAYLPYPHYRGDDYGLAWHTPEYMNDAISRAHRGELKILRYDPSGLDCHQDVYVLQREGS